RGVDLQSVLRCRLPFPDRVEVLHRKPYGIDVAMARTAYRIRTMQLQLFANSCRAVFGRALLERRHIGRRRQWRRVEEIRNHELPPKDRGRAIGRGGQRQETTLS